MKIANESRDEIVARLKSPPTEPDPSDDPGGDAPGMNPEIESDPFGGSA